MVQCHRSRSFPYWGGIHAAANTSAPRSRAGPETVPFLLNLSPCPPLSLRLPRSARHFSGSLSHTQDTIFPRAPTAETRSPSIRIDHKKVVIDDKKKSKFLNNLFASLTDCWDSRLFRITICPSLTCAFLCVRGGVALL